MQSFLAASVLVFFANGALPAQLDGDKIAQAIDKGLGYLLSLQEPDGSWKGPQTEHYYGMTSLAVYTLLKCGLDKTHPAIRAGVASVKSHPCVRTYDLGCMLMMLEALGEPQDEQEIKGYADQLVQILGNGKKASGSRWGYPGNHDGHGHGHTDLSNSQYAVLGLRAARRCGYTAGSPGFWSGIIEDLVSEQHSYGGFGYNRKDKPSSTMTVAGATMLVVALEAIGDKADLGLKGRARAGITNCYQWLRTHWRVDTVIEGRNATGYDGRWTYYLLYGYERLGAFDNTEHFGGHEWYPEGVEHILKKQEGNGKWGSGDDDTCFALLFLRRGSRSSGLGPRPRAEALASKDSPFVIGMDGSNPLNVWVRGEGQKLKEALSSGARVVGLEWRVDEQVVRHVPIATREALMAIDANLRHVATKNGKYKISARLELQSSDDKPIEFLSNTLELNIDNVEESWHREALADAGKNFLSGEGITATSSTEWDRNHGPERANDGRYGTRWITKEDDIDPWIHFSFAAPVRANTLKFLQANIYDSKNQAHYPRARDIEVKINNDPVLSLRLEDQPQKKQRAVFPAKLVRTLRVRIKSHFPGTAHRTATGFRELELFHDDSPATEALSLGPGVELLTAPARESDALWRYSLTAPPENWASPTFRDLSWKQGKAGFATTGFPYTPERTRWETPEIWVRREFTLDNAQSSRLHLEICHDDDATIFINGVRAAEAPGYSKGGYLSLPISDEAQATLKNGKNLLAIHCRNPHGAAYLDAFLTRTLKN